MRTALGDRVRRVEVHDDGLNRWRMARVAPAPALRGLVRGYTDYEEQTSGFDTRRELPHPEGTLIFNLSDPLTILTADGGTVVLGAGEAFVAGAHLKPALSRSGGVQAGLQIELPLSTLRRLFGVPMVALADTVVPLDRLLGPAAAALGMRLAEATDAAARIDLVDRALVAWTAARPALPRPQRQALALLRRRPDLDINAVADMVGWSRKHLAERVKDAVGVGPRCYRRLLRFHRLTRRLAHDGAPDWADLACEVGYYDQSHMIREFRELASMTPVQFLTRRLDDGGGLVEA